MVWTTTTTTALEFRHRLPAAKERLYINLITIQYHKCGYQLQLLVQLAFPKVDRITFANGLAWSSLRTFFYQGPRSFLHLVQTSSSSEPRLDEPARSAKARSTVDLHFTTPNYRQCGWWWWWWLRRWNWIDFIFLFVMDELFQVYCESI